jgi:CheY-like chemotaxis protein
LLVRTNFEPQPGRILVVDDDPLTRFLFMLIFETADYEVAEASDGIAALRVVKQDPPDVLVTDIVMPYMDGSALIARLKSEAETAALPIVAVSANPNARKAAAKADIVLAKTSDRGQLLEIVARFLRKATQRPPKPRFGWECALGRLSKRPERSKDGRAAKGVSSV